MCVFVYKYVFVVVVIGNVGCNPVMTNLSTSVRDFALPEDNVNTTSIRTLQKEQVARYANSAPVRNPIRFKETSDNELSSSSARVLHHEHNGYGLLDYDDNHYGHGVDYHHHDDHGLLGHHGLKGHHLSYGVHGHHGDHGDHGYGLYDHHHGDVHGHHETHVYHGDGYGHGHGHGYGYGHGHGHGHHTKDLTHALAAKTILWPIAGIALLGAAAALVSNPVLLQLGVVSGRRKRRETSETIDYDPHSFRKWLTTHPLHTTKKIEVDFDKRYAQISGGKILRPIENSRKEIIEYIPNRRKETVVHKGDILKIHSMNRMINVNKRTVLQKPSASLAYVNQSDLPRTASDGDKHYIAVPLISNS